MEKKDILALVTEIEKENPKTNKSDLDTYSFPDNLIGMERQAKELLKFLLTYKQGFLVPLISVYGRTGSGKSSLVNLVCKSLDDFYLCFVNVRMATTLFGITNLILGELGKPNLQSAQGLNMAMDNLEGSILEKLQGKKVMVLVLDEFDILFLERRSNVSDFMYKLLLLESKIKKKGKMLCIITISNNGFADYKFDDRVRSRIGNSEIFFEPYTQPMIYEILKDRAAKVFPGKISDEVLSYCASVSSDIYGDARRAIDLLRVAQEMSNGKKMKKEHIDLALENVSDKAYLLLRNASIHLKLICAGLGRVTFLSEKEWHSTVAINKQYLYLVSIFKDRKPLGYRRFSELLNELETLGLAESETRSKGRYGRGKQYKLEIDPENAIKPFFPSFWENFVKNKEKFEDLFANPGKYTPDIKRNVPIWKKEWKELVEYGPR